MVILSLILFLKDRGEEVSHSFHNSRIFAILILTLKRINMESDQNVIKTQFVLDTNKHINFSSRSNRKGKEVQQIIDRKDMYNIQNRNIQYRQVLSIGAIRRNSQGFPKFFSSRQLLLICLICLNTWMNAYISFLDCQVMFTNVTNLNMSKC